MATTEDFPQLGEPEEPYIAEAREPTNGSLLEQLRAQRAAAAPRYFDIVLPDWGAETGGLEVIARMRRVRLDKRVAKACATIERALILGEPGERDTQAACDLFILGLHELCVRHVETETVEPIDPEEPLRFTQRTAELLGLPAASAREVVLAVFGGDELRLMSAAKSYFSWLSTVRVVSDEEGKG